jgi:hypothetical protein
MKAFGGILFQYKVISSILKIHHSAGHGSRCLNSSSVGGRNRRMVVRDWSMQECETLSETYLKPKGMEAWLKWQSTCLANPSTGGKKKEGNKKKLCCLPWPFSSILLAASSRYLPASSLSICCFTCTVCTVML